MPLKVTKDMSSHLIKYIRTVDISFNPFDMRTRSARELLRQINVDRYRRANPKLKIKTNILSTPHAPSVKFAFVDGTDKNFDSKEFLADEMLMDVWRTAMKMDDDFELEGKNVEDM
ncbi:predicted protein [Thalassiosira pseudonana CCMP1335]|uniref:Large ribosomal subunit protein mL53 n=1 Tax=Thalassiosira pseudonana TaxID=35128 RepID=B8C2B5_THAPS|nr:predicted protein [Thalassiosira pseudonana CCMP1335]EED91920.1 predicted protein [Thalassiosira pseudonana CCMP1335]|mmetsp:Transcript_16295/g.35286  ORF Transcript_16295/g.35286 Transcript_16295/m.35286 type:complete len:116 (-) Transcript_16295:39-386(-)|eukprot:g13837.t1 g13837   contig9:574354-574784(+)